MNGDDQITLNKLHQIVTTYVKENDKRWKKIEPVVEAYHNQKVIDRFLSKVWKGAVAVLIAFSLIGGIWTLFRGN